MLLACQVLILCLDSKLGEKRKEGEVKGRKEKKGEKKRGKRLYCLYRKEQKRKQMNFIFLSNLFSY